MGAGGAEGALFGPDGEAGEGGDGGGVELFVSEVEEEGAEDGVGG